MQLFIFCIVAVALLRLVPDGHWPAGVGTAFLRIVGSLSAVAGIFAALPFGHGRSEGRNLKNSRIRRRTRPWRKNLINLSQTRAQARQGRQKP